MGSDFEIRPSSRCADRDTRHNMLIPLMLPIHDRISAVRHLDQMSHLERGKCDIAALYGKGWEARRELNLHRGGAVPWRLGWTFSESTGCRPKAPPPLFRYRHLGPSTTSGPRPSRAGVRCQ